MSMGPCSMYVVHYSMYAQSPEWRMPRKQNHPVVRRGNERNVEGEVDATRWERKRVHFPAYASGLGDNEGDVGELVDGLRAGLHRNEKQSTVRTRPTRRREWRMLTPTKDRWAIPRLTSPLEKDDGMVMSKFW